MLTQELVDYHAVLLDKFASPNLTESETVDMLNHAVQEYLNRLFPDSQGGVVNVEADSNVVANVQPLIYTISTTMNGTTGLVTEAVLNTALQTESGDADSDYFRILSAGLTSDGVTYPVRYIRQNNLYPALTNYFKEPTVTNPRYTLTAKGLRFYPIDATKTLTITVVKQPKVLSLDPVVNSELSSYSLYQILMIALQLSGVSIRDSEMLQEIQNITVQGK